MNKYLYLISVPIIAACTSTKHYSKYSKEYDKCIDKSEGVTASMLDCNGAETNRQDTRLNSNFKKVIAELTDPRKKQLKDVEQLWIKFRDANCSFYYDPEEGTASQLGGSSCFLKMITERADELELFIQGPDEASGKSK